MFASGVAGGGVGSAPEFAVDFVGVTMTPQFGQESVGGFGRGDAFGGEERGQTALPRLMLALDLAFGLRGAGVTERDAVKEECRAELGEGVGVLREEETVAIDVVFEGQAVFEEGCGGKSK